MIGFWCFRRRVGGEVEAWTADGESVHQTTDGCARISHTDTSKQENKSIKASHPRNNNRDDWNSINSSPSLPPMNPPNRALSLAS